MQSNLLQLCKPKDYCETEEKIEKTTSTKYNLETEPLNDEKLSQAETQILSKS